MPEELKPVWIDGSYDNQADAAAAMQRHLIGTALEGVPMPVLTLDQMEAWLKREDELSQLNGERGYVSCRDLLAQVQAWRGGT